MGVFGEFDPSRDEDRARFKKRSQSQAEVDVDVDVDVEVEVEAVQQRTVSWLIMESFFRRGSLQHRTASLTFWDEMFISFQAEVNRLHVCA